VRRHRLHPCSDRRPPKPTHRRSGYRDSVLVAGAALRAARLHCGCRRRRHQPVALRRPRAVSRPSFPDRPGPVSSDGGVGVDVRPGQSPPGADVRRSRQRPQHLLHHDVRAARRRRRRGDGDFGRPGSAAGCRRVYAGRRQRRRGGLAEVGRPRLRGDSVHRRRLRRQDGPVRAAVQRARCGLLHGGRAVGARNHAKHTDAGVAGARNAAPFGGPDRAEGDVGADAGTRRRADVARPRRDPCPTARLVAGRPLLRVQQRGRRAGRRRRPDAAVLLPDAAEVAVAGRRAAAPDGEAARDGAECALPRRPDVGAGATAEREAARPLRRRRAVGVVAERRGQVD